MTTLAGLSAVVTGSSRDMGAFTARQLAALGAKVVVHYNSAKQPALDTASAIEAAGGEAIAAQADLTSRAGASSLIAASLDAFGSVDILVCNVGGFLRKPFLETTDEEFHQQFALNTDTLFFCISEAVPHMMSRGFGRIVTFGAAGAEFPTRNSQFTAYASAKAAVVALTRALAPELAPHGITVNCVEPGIISDKAPTRADSEAITVKHTPVGHVGSFEDVSDAVSFLVRRESSYITGAVLEVGGGWRM